MRIWLGLKLDVSFISDDQIMLRELSLVGIELLLEQRHLAFSLFVLELPELCLMLLLQLGLLELEVLLLGLDDHGKLGLLGLGLFDQAFKLRDLFEILDFFGSQSLGRACSASLGVSHAASCPLGQQGVGHLVKRLSLAGEP